MSYIFSSLSMPVSSELIKQYEALQLNRMGISGRKVTTFCMYGLVILLIVAALVTIFFDFFSGRVGDGMFNLIGYLFSIGVVIGIGLLILRYQKYLWVRTIRISQFAYDNNFSYTASIDSPVLAGMYFDIGHTRNATYVINGHIQGTPFELANYSYVVGSGKNSHTYTLGYIRIKLERQLPHIVLDAIKNNFKLFGFDSSNLPISFQKDQAMQLEGNFNDYFRLYAPRGYERDALYVFTPDLMALFIDIVTVHDAEIIDDQLFIYTPVGIQYEDTAYMQDIFRIIEVIGHKTISRTDRYQDERTALLGPNTVGTQGKRLRKSTVATFVFSLVLTAFICVYAYFTLDQFR